MAGTYVYCFGGIETMLKTRKIQLTIGTYVYCFGTACHPAHDAGSSPGTLSGISGFRVVARNDGTVYCFGGIETSIMFDNLIVNKVPMSTASAVLRPV